VEIALEVRGIGVRFGDVEVLRDVTAAFEAGLTSAVVGPNGAGKSTLLNCICGLVPAAQGEVLLQGTPITNIKPHKLVHAGVGRSFQGAQFVKDLSAVDNVMVGDHSRLKMDLWRAAFRTPRSRRVERECRERAMAALERVGVQRYADRPIRELPFGVQKRVDIARALVTQPSLVLLDEPMAGLTRPEKDEVMDVLEQLRETQGPTLIIVEHDMRVVSRLASSVVVLAAGTVLAQGHPTDVLNRPDVVEAYLGKGHDAPAGGDGRV
jgi:ABC-type branched-subunit amino acid transport system ATPase component